MSTEDAYPSWYEAVARVDQIEPVTAGRVKSLLNILADVTNDAWDMYRKNLSSFKRWNLWYFTLGLPAAIIAAASGVSAVEANTTLAAWLAFTAAAVSAAIGFLKPDERRNASLDKYTKALNISDRARLFAESGLPNILIKRDQLDSQELPRASNTVSGLTEELAALRKGSDPELVQQKNLLLTATPSMDAESAVPDTDYQEAGSPPSD